MKLPALALSGLVAIVAAAVLVAPALGTDPAAGDPLLQTVRSVSARYHSLEQAEQAGYSGANEPCVASPAGAMGYHYVNSQLAGDGELDPSRPEILLYAPKQNGGVELVGVEYFIPAAQTTSVPVLFGRTFNGPMPGHNPFMPVHYDLHVWLWQPNPSGLFSPWNPAVSC